MNCEPRVPFLLSANFKNQKAKAIVLGSIRTPFFMVEILIDSASFLLFHHVIKSVN
jgi:hypothetical protein